MAEQPFDSHPARYWHKLEDGRIQCDLCPRFCKLHEGQRAETARREAVLRVLAARSLFD